RLPYSTRPSALPTPSGTAGVGYRSAAPVANSQPLGRWLSSRTLAVPSPATVRRLHDEGQWRTPARKVFRETGSNNRAFYISQPRHGWQAAGPCTNGRSLGIWRQDSSDA